MIKNVSFEGLTGTTLGNYSLERFIGQSRLGPTFLARATTATTYLVRFLSTTMQAAPREHEAYLERFQYQAGQIATLQHPYLLPLLDFGVYRGFPYLVSPHIPLRSLRTRIEKNGALNTLTVGRYLDQMATALEYAHEHSVLHSGLSVDSTFIRLDGQLVVADVGVRSLLELNAQDLSRLQLLELSEGFAPEQLLGKPTGPATDVYALGAVTYYLLTGSPVFDGNNLNEIAQQHLYSTIPPLTQWRSDLPTGLYGILARALAKDPTQRFHQPGAFANAYHNNVDSMINGTRLPFVVSDASGPPLVAGEAMVDGPFVDRAWNGRMPQADHMPGSQRAATQSAVNPPSLPGYTVNEPLRAPNGSRPDLMHRFGRKQHQRNLLYIASLFLVLVLAGIVGTILLTQQNHAVAGSGGQVVFFSSQNDPGGQTNSLRINLQHLATPPAGNDYRAWIINDQSEQVLSLGTLVEKNQTWSLTFSAANSNLLEVGDKLEITQEQGAANAPTGNVVLAGTFPVMAFQHIQHLLVSFPETPGKVGMLMGLLNQTHQLDIQSAVLQSVSGSQNKAAIECLSQSMLDIIEGKQGAHYKPLAATCAQQNITATGDGFGLLGKGYMASAEEHASLALGQKDATSLMRQHAALMDIAISNINSWVTTIDQDLLNLLAHPTDLSSIQQVMILADNAYRGVDANGNGQIEPITGEAGAIMAYQQGQLMATLTLTPAS